MPLKQLFLAVVAVGLFAMLAFYLMELNTISEEQVSQPAPTTSTNHEEQTESEAEAPAPTSANTQVPASNATSPTNDTVTTGSNTEADTSSVEDDLSELDALFDEDYDDSSVDDAFSGNLDEAI